MNTTSVLVQGLLIQVGVLLIPIAILSLIAWFMISKVLKRIEKQQHERLAFEKENAQQVADLNTRLVAIEKLLKEVD